MIIEKIFSLSKIVFLQILFLGYTNAISAQVTDIIAPPPNAAALTTYNNIPVGLYSGKADITLEILNLVAGEFNLPVSLQYDPSLVKVSGYASRVGLGWILNCGGVITRSIVGIADEIPGGGFNSTFNSLPLDDSRPIRPLTNQIRNFRDGASDSEPDIYSYSLLQGGGSFLNTGTRFLPQNNRSEKIEKIPGVGSLFSFKITDGKGYQYYFQDPEMTNYSVSNRSGSAPTAWYLTKIVNPNRTDSLIFTYDGFNYQFAADYAETIYEQFDAGTSISPSYQNQSQIISGKVLSSVKSSVGTLKFFYSNRSDCEDKKVDQIVLLDRTEQIVLKKIAFNYDYFSQYAANTKLRLLSYTVGDQNKVEMTYKFNYTGNLYPASGSKAQDHWGYYNGKENNTSWIPTHLTSLGATFNGANKETDVIAIQNGLLKDILYPTGGYTAFQFEPNEYSNTLIGGAPDASGGPPVNVTESLSGTNANGMLVEKSITVDFQQSATITYRIGNCRNGDSGGNCTSPGSLPPSTIIKVMFGNTLAASFTSNSSNQIKSGSLTLGLQPGTYKIIIETPEQFDFGSVQLIFKKYGTSIPMKKWIGGGLRIKSIVYSDGINFDRNIVKSYDYANQADPEKSNGTLINKPRYDFTFTQYGMSSPSGAGPSCIDPVRYKVWSSFPGNISTTSGGSYVFYLEGIEKNSGSGEVRYEYAGDNSYRQINVPPFRLLKKSWKENLLIKKTYYDSSVQKLKEESFEYVFDNYNNIPAIRGVRVGSAVDCPVDKVMSNGEFQINSVYFDSYLLNFEQLRQKNETITDYYGGAAIVSTNKSWFEDIYANLTKEESIDSKGGVNRTLYSYANSFLAENQVYLQMQSRNMIAIPIETKKFKGTTLIKSSKNNFAFWHNDSKIALSSFQTSTGNSPLEDDLIISEYDSKGNIAEQYRPSGSKEVYLWGYNSKYPVAKIIGSTYTVVKGLINQNSLDNPTTDITLRDYLNTTLRTALPSSFTTIYTYKPLIGMTSLTDEKGLTSYYNFDNIGRLMNVKDHNQRIIKTINYNYQR